MSKLSELLHNVAQFVKNLLPWVKNAIQLGIEVGNEVKQIIDNPAWDIAVSFTGTKLDDAALKSLRLFLAMLLVDLNLADGNLKINTDTAEVFKQASKAINDMFTIEAKAGTLNTISAAAATKIAELKDKSTLPLESALSSVQPAYAHPELLEQ